MAMSFHNFIQSLAQSATQQPLERVALGYWHDYQTGRPIDGGVAFEPMLRKIPLDGSLKSLQILDKFLDKAKPHLADNALLVSQKSDQRNLLLFIGFYAGWVLAYQARQQSQPSLPVASQWLTLNKLCQHYPALQRLIVDDFSYSVAISLRAIDEGEQRFNPALVSDSVFFPLVSIIERLYPQRQTALNATAPYFGYINASLHDSVTQLLARWQTASQATNEPLTAETLAPTIATFATPLQIPATHTLPAMLLSDLDNPLMERKDWATSDTPATAEAMTEPVITYRAYAVPDFSELSMNVVEQSNHSVESLPTEASSTPQQATVDADTLTTVDLVDSKNTTKPNSNDAPTNASTTTAMGTDKKPITQQKINSRGLSSRQAIAEAKKQAKELARQKAEREAELAKQAEAKRQAEIAEALANPRINEKLLQQRKSMLEERAKIKDSFSELEQDLQTAQLPDNLPNNAKHAYQQALQIIQQSPHQQTDKALAIVAKLAQANSTDALLHQALWQLRGREDLGIEKNVEQGIAWVKQSAQLQDNRAEKLLSKLYFSGEIVGMDSEQGKFWLDQAAKHGHAEAQRLQQSFMLVTNLKETRQDEDNYLKKLAIGTAILLLFAIVVIFAIKI